MFDGHFGEHFASCHIIFSSYLLRNIILYYIQYNICDHVVHKTTLSDGHACASGNRYTELFCYSVYRFPEAHASSQQSARMKVPSTKRRKHRVTCPNTAASSGNRYTELFCYFLYGFTSTKQCKHRVTCHTKQQPALEIDRQNYFDIYCMDFLKLSFSKRDKISCIHVVLLLICLPIVFR
jgi:hypothetical protein